MRDDEPRYHDELEQFDPYFMERWRQEQEESTWIDWYPCETCGEGEDFTCHWSEEKQAWLCSQCGQPVELVEEE